MRVYNEDGDELGSHIDLTLEITPGETWRFETSPHSRVGEITNYAVAVMGE